MRSAQALGVSARSALPRNRFPAFLELVRQQLASRFRRTRTRCGRSDHPYDAVAVRAIAGRSRNADRRSANLGKRDAEVESAVVVTAVPSGEVQALIGSRHADAQGFNRALDARRPIGSLVKPFVYLVALAQPQRYSLATRIDDAPVDMPQRDGSRWVPKNDDGDVHGEVLLIDALKNSWNLATVQLGLRLGVDKVRGLLESFGLGRDINPNPSLLAGRGRSESVRCRPALPVLRRRRSCGALARGARRGRCERSHAVALRRKPGTGDYVAASRLVTWAMQQVVESGTARSIGAAGLGDLHAAGKTGTSDTQRDSWFAGFSGNQLGVVWVGRDDNRPTGLYGSTGALKVWIDLFRQLACRTAVAARRRHRTSPGSTRKTAGAATRRVRERANCRSSPAMSPRTAKAARLDKLRQWFGGDGN